MQNRNECAHCGKAKRKVHFEAFGYTYDMDSNLCQQCWEYTVKQDALRLREEDPWEIIERDAPSLEEVFPESQDYLAELPEGFGLKGKENQ